MKKILALVGTVAAVIVIILLIRWNPSQQTPSGNNVSIENGKQIITISAQGGYSPLRTIAKAGIPTELHVVTNGTYDCSASVSIPSMHVYTNLQPTGTKTIDLGTPSVGVMPASCGMGMYRFEIDFQG